MSNMMADRDEDFNTRYASYRGWQMAIEKVKPIPRHTAPLDLTRWCAANGCETTAQVVDYFGAALSARAACEAPTRDAARSPSWTTSSAPAGSTAPKRYMEDPLRLLLHLIMSLPEYQLG